MANRHMVSIRLNDHLELELNALASIPMKTIRCRLNRITAQHLADALLQYCNAAGKSAGRGRDILMGAEDLTEAPKPIKSGVVRLDSPRRRGVVKL